MSLAVNNVNLARTQFGSLIIYHFFFVPITIGLAWLVAILQTMWHRSGNPLHLRLTRFFGAMLLINVAIGVATGFVQEFEFGMNWSAYSRFVGDVFGGPLAMEGLAAFFLESTFLGLWIFGWDRLPKRVHLACIYLVAIGSMLSAAFIMTANSWMQHPVGYKINATTGRPQLTNIIDLFTNPVFLWGYTHVILAALVTGSVVMLATSAWHLRRKQNVDAFRRSAQLSLVVLLPAIVLQLIVGGRLGVNETTYQPMKIAGAEAQFQTCQPCSFSLFQIGGFEQGQSPTKIIQVPHLLSILATGTWNGKVNGLTPLNAQYQQQYGPGNYIPNAATQYWAMRTMAYLGVLVLLIALWSVFALWRGSFVRSKWLLRVLSWAVILPLLINTAGWFLTENGRQPWIVQGLMTTTNGVSATVSSTWVWISLLTLIAIYVVLAVVYLVLMLRYAHRDLPAEEEPAPSADGEAAPVREPALTY